MRVVVDAGGREWSVTLGRESYGVQVLLFVAAGEGVRKALLASDTRIDAQSELDALSDAELADRLAASVPWEGSLMG